ncbi:MAG: glycosyltransferase [Alphaproteobacteria bacterium]
MTQRIVFLLPSFAGGGAERVALSLLADLPPARYLASLIVMTGNGPLVSLVPPTTPLLDCHQPRLRRALWPILRALRQQRPAVIFTTMGYMNLALLAARHLLPRGTRIVVREANLPSLSLTANRLSWLFRQGYRRLYRQADMVICTSEEMRRQMTVDFAVAPDRARILPNPVDVSALRKAATPTVRPAGTAPHFVAAGRLHRQKGFDRLLDLFATLAGSPTLTILGTGPDGQDLRDQVAALALSERVTLPGFEANPWRHIAGADAFLMPSRWEGMPNAALEALACGTPVIATTQSGGLPELLASVPHGLTIAPFGKAFHAAMATVSADSTQQPRPSILPTSYHRGAVANRFADLLDQLLAPTDGQPA